MGNEAVTKVFHAARQDIEIIFHLGGLIPHPVFDTQVAAMVCGFGDSVSYDQLVQKITGAQPRQVVALHRLAAPAAVGQAARIRAGRRHPPDRRLQYHLKAELERENRAHWLNEEMEVLTSRADLRSASGGCLEAAEDAASASRRNWPSLQAVAAWREREARERNVPRGRVIKDDAIYEIAQQQPRDATALGRLRTTPKGWERSATATALLAVVNTALGHAQGRSCRSCRSMPQAQEGSNAAAELLKVLLRLVAEKEGVAAKVLASGDDIDRLATDGEEADVPALHGWRREVFGEQALQADPRRDRAEIREAAAGGVRNAR